MSRESYVPAQEGPPPPFSPTGPDRGPDATPLAGSPYPAPPPAVPFGEAAPTVETPLAAYPPPALHQPRPPARPMRGAAWHRHHYTIGVFVTVFGLTNLVTGLIGHAERIEEMNLALPVFIVVKAVEAVLLAVTVAGLIRKKDVWFLPSLLGWLLGFAAFCVYDLVKGNIGMLAEHAVFAVLFAVLLAVSYRLSSMVRTGRVAPTPSVPRQSGSRTQEIALNALSRWQRIPPPR